MRITIIALDGTAKTAIQNALTTVVGESVTMTAEDNQVVKDTPNLTGRHLLDMNLTDAQEVALRSHSVALAATNLRMCLRTDTEESGTHSSATVASASTDKFQVRGDVPPGVSVFWAAQLAPVVPPEDGGKDS